MAGQRACQNCVSFAPPKPGAGTIGECRISEVFQPKGLLDWCDKFKKRKEWRPELLDYLTGKAEAPVETKPVPKSIEAIQSTKTVPEEVDEDEVFPPTEDQIAEEEPNDVVDEAIADAAKEMSDEE